MKLNKFLESMKHSPISNYGGIPGVTSWLIGEPSARGLVRLMECSRDHYEPIIPHSHRFDFHCLVLAGRVRNILWTPDNTGDEFVQSILHYDGAPGDYTKGGREHARWRAREMTYAAGAEYSMTSTEVHSIYFARGTAVLFYEGPRVSNTSIILEPCVDGKHVPTFKVEPWAFKRVAK